jgi:hypothetical protein
MFYFHPQFKLSTHYGVITLLPIVYWFVLFIISIYPLKNNTRFFQDKFANVNHKRLDIVAYFLVFISLTSAMIYFPHIGNATNAVDFELNKTIYQSGEFIVTNNKYLMSIVNIHSTLRSLVSFLFIYYVAFIPTHKTLKILLGVSAVVPIVFMSMAKCVRVDTAFMILQIFLLYFFYKTSFSDKVRFVVKVASLTIAIIGAFIMISFSLVRFANYDFDPLFYIYSYLSEGVLNFNTLFFDHINLTTNGDMVFPIIKKYFGYDYAVSGEEYKFMYLNKLEYICWYFYTYIGDLGRDLGLFRTIIFISFVSIMVSLLTKKIKPTFLSVFFLYMYADFIICGLFYNKYSYLPGNTNLQNLIIIVCIIYLFIKKNHKINV